VSDNFFRNVVRAGVDQARKDVQASRASRPEASALVREAQQQGDVTRITAQGRPQRRAVAQVKGRMLTSMKAEQQAEVGGATKAIGSLSKPEQRAFKYAMQYGTTTPDAARRVLPAVRERVAAGRAAHEASTGERIPARQNELPEIDYLLKNADQAFTPRLAETDAPGARPSAERREPATRVSTSRRPRCAASLRRPSCSASCVVRARTPAVLPRG
jgi:hypothetical protein